LGQNPTRGPTATHHFSLPGLRYKTLLTPALKFKRGAWGRGWGGEGKGVWEKSESNNYIPFGDVVKNYLPGEQFMVPIAPSFGQFDPPNIDTGLEQYLNLGLVQNDVPFTFEQSSSLVMVQLLQPPLTTFRNIIIIMYFLMSLG
jgi:hypothetical protein